ncbi:MAG: efflux RND transporter permease subunit [Ancalomicrobiaceae bacterium]|nr:efflux RND transporter permease subunit [Ancalomicrobiaceae bacterium]
MAPETPPVTHFNLSRWAIQHKSLTRFLFFLALLAGLFSLTQMGQKEDPDFTFRVMVVQVVWPGSSINELQDQVVDKIERKLQETPHLDYLKSFTRAGTAVITVAIKGSASGRDIPDAFYQVRKKVGDIASSFPAGVLGPYFNDEFGDTFISLDAISGDGFTYPELKTFAKRGRDQLLRVKGVEKVEILGDQDEKVFIDVSSRTLAERGLTANDIKAALTGQNAQDPAGSVDTTERSVRVTVEGNALSLEDFRSLPLKAGKEVIRLGDIATVSRGTEEPFTHIHRYNGKNAVLLGITMASGYNVTTVGKDIRAAYAEFEASLPHGVTLGSVSDQSDVVTKAIDEFSEALIEALAIVLGVSFLSIGWRAGTVVAITIPFVLAATFAVLYLLGIDLQRVSLGALIIALGLLVDDAMIAVEMMERKLEEGLDKVSAAGFAYTSTAFPMLTGTLITAAGFIPVGFAASTAGEYVRSLFIVVGVALIVSWIAAVYFTPAIGHMILKARPHQPGETHRDVYAGRAYRMLRSAIAWFVGHRILVVTLTIIAFGLGVYGFKFVPKSFFPASTRPEILVDMWLPEGTSTAETARQAKAFEARILVDQDQRYIATFIGEGAPRFFMPLDQQLRNPNFAQFLVMAKDVPARERLIAEMRRILAEDFPAVRSKVDRLNLGPPTGWPVQMRVMGPNREEVRRLADKVEDTFRADPRLSVVHDDWLESVPSLKLVIDQDRARALGVSSQTIRRVLAGSLSGAPIGEFREGEETISVVVREPAANRTLLTAIEEAYVPTDQGRMVPISQVAKVVTVMDPGIEWRRDGLPTITVRGVVPNGVESNDVAADIFARLGSLRDGLQPGYHIELQGGAEDSATSRDSIAAKAPPMILIVLVLLMLQLQHTGKMLLALAAGPLGLIGASAALLLTNSAFGFVAILGVIALNGIIIRNSVILIDQIDQDLDAGVEPYEAIIGSAVRRFRPIMLTAMAAVLALVPIARSPFWGPMAYAMMGGILAATILTVLVLPAAYALFFRVRRPTAVRLPADGPAADAGSSAPGCGKVARLKSETRRRSAPSQIASPPDDQREAAE